MLLRVQSATASICGGSPSHRAGGRKGGIDEGVKGRRLGGRQGGLEGSGGCRGVLEDVGERKERRAEER